MSIKKKLIMLAASTCLLLGAGVLVFAAYTFRKNVKDETAEIGQIEVDSKKFYSYKDSTNSSFRSDAVARLDDMILKTSESYVNATTKGANFQSNVTYYVVGTYVKANVSYGDTINGTYYVDVNGGYSQTADTKFTSGTTYYEKTSATGYTATSTVSIGTTIVGTYYVKTVTYVGITSIGKSVLKDNTSLTCTIDNSDTKKFTVKNGTTLLFTVTCTMDSVNGIGSATVTPADNTKHYGAVIDTDYSGMIIIDNDATATSRTEIKDSNNNAVTSVVCSATEDKNNSDNIYLNQLGFGFTFTNEVLVYVRIHIQDAWVSIRQYSSNVKRSYSIKDQISGNSPFAVTDLAWHYDAQENTAYLLAPVSATKTDDEYDSHTYYFNVNQAYYYIPSGNTVYKEYMDVEVSFKVDIVQANRVVSEWGFDPSTLS